MSVSNLVAWVNAWMRYVGEQTCVKPIIYTSKGVLLSPPANLEFQLYGYSYWVANPQNNPDPAQTPVLQSTGIPLLNWQFQQYQDQDTGGFLSPGVTGPADLDSFSGDPARLLSLTNYTPGTKFFGTGGGIFQPPSNGIFSLDISTCGQQQITQVTIQGSDNFLNWTDLQTITVTNGIVSFTDTTVASHPAKFYRVKP